MKKLIDYILELKECNIATPMNTIGMGDIVVTPDGSSDPLIITGKPKKLKKVKKKSIKESEYYKESYNNLSEILENIINDDDFYDDNYALFNDDDDEETLRIKLIDGHCVEVCVFVSDYYSNITKGIKYYLLDDKGKDYHFLMRYNDLWYDGYNYKGVEKLEKLKFIELNKSYHKYDEGELHNHLHLVSEDEFDFNKAQKMC